jgi:hypothetical protein
MKAVLILLVIAFSIGAYADVNIFLLPKFDAANDNITLGDLSKIECDETCIETLRAIEINRSLYKDGLVDRREIIELIKGKIDEPFTVYGSAVRIIRKDPLKKENNPDSKLKNSVNSGEPVDLIVRKNGIVLQLSGTALQDGKTGESVKVMLRGNRRIKGRIAEKSLVEVFL